MTPKRIAEFFKTEDGQKLYGIIRSEYGSGRQALKDGIMMYFCCRHSTADNAIARMAADGFQF